MTTRPDSVLVVDDDLAVGKVLIGLLQQAGFACRHATSAEGALEVLKKAGVDVVLTDLRMPGMGGLALVEELARTSPEVPVIVLTAHGTVPLAVEAMKKGAADFLLKPFDREEILFTLRKALARSSREDGSAVAGGAAFGGSQAMAEVRAMVAKAAKGIATVLVRGESGTGKELCARALHDEGPRRDGPFVKVHCAALPEALLESELFGYEKGAFTGATSQKPGRVELAEGGTLFLDEIGDISPATQVKLLRLLQDREYERLGGTRTLKADVRFVSATHQPLEELVEKKIFREDLFYRLNVVPIWIPPLRERPDDIAPLARGFCARFGEANGKPGLTLEPAAVDLLVRQPWPGNVRQLQNFLERLVVLSEGTSLAVADVTRELERPGIGNKPAAAAEAQRGGLADQRRELERQAVQEALRKAGDNRTVAARLLGVSRRTLYNKLHELGLEQA